MPYFFVDYYYILLVIPAMIIAAWAQVKVKSTYKKFSQIENARRITGAYAAQAILSHYGITDVRIEQVSGKLTDHYDPKAKVIRLSEGVYNSTSIAAVGIACHEAGHAAQHAEAYKPIKIRNSLVPVCNIGSYIGVPLALLGYFLGFEPLITVGLLLYAAIFVFQVVTLPVEFNASRRAINCISERGLLAEDEVPKAKKVLSAAAMTYVASMIVALANLLRLILRFRSRD
ncbi:MAG: zinc metallopeptidase [Clostridia bacterium]|nr:zinc metallopeptidase [Clostridia bacterium]MBQ3006854.1 zinc metallopeptidase [Clostridia bacterium]